MASVFGPEVRQSAYIFLVPLPFHSLISVSNSLFLLSSKRGASFISCIKQFKCFFIPGSSGAAPAVVPLHLYFFSNTYLFLAGNAERVFVSIGAEFVINYIYLPAILLFRFSGQYSRHLF